MLVDAVDAAFGAISILQSGVTEFPIRSVSLRLLVNSYKKMRYESIVYYAGLEEKMYRILDG